MQLIYRGKDITDAVEISKADIIDNAGGIADSVELQFNDPRGYWRDWKPQKNDEVEIIHEGFKSGAMFVDELEQNRGTFIVRALSIPQVAKTSETKAWEDIRLLQVAEELAAKHRFDLQHYGIENHLYSRIDQQNIADFEHLSQRCMLEGYALKLTDRKAVIYDERYMESQLSVKAVYMDQFDGPFKFWDKATGTYSACTLSYGNISYTFKPDIGPTGPVLKVKNIYVSSRAEAERFASNILRNKNKDENTGYFTIQLDAGIAAGNTMLLPDTGFGDGKYFCYQVVHKIIEQKSFIRVRKPLEGY